MNKSKFTKGPWHLGVCEQASPYNTVQVPTVFVYGYTICTLNPKDKRDQDGNWLGFDECNHFDRLECRANARIIKEAPAMRSFLDRLLDWDRDFGITSPLGMLVLADLIRDAQNLVKATESEQ